MNGIDPEFMPFAIAAMREKQSDADRLVAVIG